VTQAHRLDYEPTATDRRFVVQSGDEDGAIEPARARVCDARGKDRSDEQLRSDHPRVA